MTALQPNTTRDLPVCNGNAGPARVAAPTTQAVEATDKPFQLMRHALARLLVLEAVAKLHKAAAMADEPFKTALLQAASSLPYRD